MTRILSPLVVGYLNNSNQAQLHERFGFISDVLIRHGLRQVGWELRTPGHEDEVWAEAGFVFDFESIPNIIRGPIGENKRGGAAHDISSRKNVFVGRGLTSDELAILNNPNTSREDVISITLRAKGEITRSIAADVYFEIMEYCDSIDTQRFAAHKHPHLHTSIIIPYVKTKDWTRRWLKSTVVRFWPGGYWQKYEMTATPLEIYGIASDPYVTIEKLEALIEKTKQVAEDLKDKDVESGQTEEMVEKTDQITEDLKVEKEKVIDLLTPTEVNTYTKNKEKFL